MLRGGNLIKSLVRSSLRCHRIQARSIASANSTDGGSNSKDELLFRQDLALPGLHLDDIDEIMSQDIPIESSKYYPRLEVDRSAKGKPTEGHNLMVIQPWVAYANFSETTEPELQLDECVSLANTIHNWKVVEKRIVFANQMNRKQILGPKAFEELKQMVHDRSDVSAVFFGLEILSAIQFTTLEKELKLPVYDRFTVVLNIFRQHARTREAKLQVALAELPYIKSYLREIHESSEFCSSAESLKMLVGGSGETFYQRRLEILKRRERKLKLLLADIEKQREQNKKLRRRSDIPIVSIVGYTNCGKTSLIKYLTNDERLVPKDQLFATLDVSVHLGQLPSSKKVFYLDTVGFLSRIPMLLIQAFSATLKDVQESDLIVHLLDVTHPDHKLQRATVIKALESLKVSKNLLETRLTIGNKIDLFNETASAGPESLPKCDMMISVTDNHKLSELVQCIDNQLMANLKHENRVVRIENGGKKYIWLRKNATILDAQADESDANYLICHVIMSPTALGRWSKQFGHADFLVG